MKGDPVVHVIDDDDAARDALKFLLSTANYSVRTYESAKVFLDAFPSTEAGCIITDVRMPEISGLDLLQRLKSRAVDWPVIVITGQADVPIAIEAIKSGAVDFIEKPYDAEVLLEAVNLALSGKMNAGLDAQTTELQQKLTVLSPQERKLLDALVDGRSNKEITLDLGLNARTFEIQRATVMTKMGATTLSHLVRMMLRCAP